MYREMNVCEFIKATSSSDPTPGGGSVSSFCGALGVALAQMVANLTLGKKEYQDVQDEMKNICVKADEIKKELMRLIDKDAEAFSEFMDALKLPKDTDEQNEYRQSIMQKSLKSSASVPMEIAEISYKVMDLAEIALEKGNKNAFTDAAIAGILSRSAVLSAILNVRINLKSIKDEQFVQRLESKCIELEGSVKNREKAILNSIEF